VSDVELSTIELSALKVSAIKVSAIKVSAVKAGAIEADSGLCYKASAGLLQAARFEGSSKVRRQRKAWR
jgi:hypothetical protein